MRVKSFKKKSRSDWLNLFEIAYEDKAGGDRSWQLASRRQTPRCISGDFDIPDAVVIVPYHFSSGKLVLIKEYRVPLADYQYGFPAGLIDPGETIESAVERELREETGLTLERVKRIGPPIYSSPGMSDESICMVYVECDGTPSNEANEGTEDISVIMVSKTEAAALLNVKDVKFDAKAWLTLSAYVQSGSF
jgi:ADP-ribose pyrophosphatase